MILQYQKVQKNMFCTSRTSRNTYKFVIITILLINDFINMTNEAERYINLSQNTFKITDGKYLLRH